MQSRERDSNIELLRIYSMVLIAANHIVNLGVLEQVPGQWYRPWAAGGPVNRILAAIFTSCGKVGVAVFFMVSGYFLIKRDKIPVKSFWVMLGKVHFCGLTMFLIFWAVHAATGYAEGVHLERAFIRSVFLSEKMWWFALHYMILLIISPWLNNGLLLLKKKRLLLPVLLIIWYFFYLNGTSQFYYNSVRTLLFYMIGAVIRLGEDRIPRVPVLYAVLSIAAWAGCTVLSYITLNVSAGKMTDPGLVFIWTRTEFNYGFLAAARAIFMFLFFRHLSFQWEPVNRLAGCTFGVYLCHTYPYLRNFMIYDLMKIDEVYLKSTFPLWLAVDVIAVFCAGVLFEQLFKVCAGVVGRVIQKSG